MLPLAQHEADAVPQSPLTQRMNMHLRMKLLLAALTASVVMIGAVSTASANRLSVSSRNIRVVWNSTLSQRLTFTGSGVFTPECDITMDGSFHSNTIVKTRGLLIGYITAVTIGACEGINDVSILGLPWHIQYHAFVGTLPTITGVTLLLVGVSFNLDAPLAGDCLYRSTTAAPARGTIAITGGVAGLLTPDSTALVPLNSGGFLCPGSGGFTGTGATMVLNALSTRLTIRLI